MNKDILYLYRGLSPQTQESIASIFKDSPKTLLFAAFLENEKELDFKTSKAVSYIYQEEQKTEGLSHAVLVNRFYKLRQSFRQWLLIQFRSNETCTTPEERELVFLRLMVAKNEFTHAREGLEKLAQQCRIYCLYELLPEIELLLLFCVQSLQTRDLQAHNQQWLALQEATDLAHQLNQLFSYYMQSFDGNVLADCLDNIRKICTKYPQVIRFQLIYRYTAFFRGVFHPEMNQKSRHVLVRHLNELTNLLAENPNIPIINSASKERILYSLETAKMSFFMHGNDFPQALQCFRTRQKLAKSNPLLSERKSEPEYRNIIVVLIANELYKEAVDVAQEFLKYYQHQKPHTTNKGYLDLSYCYIFGIAVVRPSPNQTEHILQQLQALAQEHEGVYQTEAISARWWWLLLLNRGADAQAWAETHTLTKCIYPLNYEPIPISFFSTLQEMALAPNAPIIEGLQQQLQELTAQCRPLARLYLNRLVHFLQNLLAK